MEDTLLLTYYYKTFTILIMKFSSGNNKSVCEKLTKCHIEFYFYLFLFYEIKTLKDLY